MAPLLGPPATPLPPSAADPSPNSADPFVDLMTTHFNATNPAKKPPMGFTENSSPTFLSTGNPCLDFFFHVVPDTPPVTLVDFLSSAWAHDPLATLKLICHLRGVRGTGKSDKEGFYTAALWLHQHHPKTLALNLKQISRFGYLKDMPEILFRQLAGNDARKIAKAERGRSKSRRYKGRFKRRAKSTAKKSVVQKMLKGLGSGTTVSPEAARDLRHKRIAELARRAVERYDRDPDYKFLHDRVSDLFSELLVSDLQALKSGNLQRLGLAAKWCPSLDSSFDKWTLLCESIARRVFPRESDSEYRDLEERFYAFRIRDRLRKEILVPLRQALELPEVYMSAKRWDSLPYNRVASVAMKNYKSLFRKHDPERFGKFLEQVKEGKAKIAAGALLPHEILADAEDDVADLQWKRMVSDLSKKGKLTNCIAVCDVSGSMSGTPMDVCVALGILISDLCEDPWKGKVITFSATPKIHLIKGETLKEKVEFVRGMEWGMNTNFQKVFDILLEVAANGRLPEEKMIKRVFVFSDMEFDVASENRWETDYEAIKRKFSERGYSRAPEIVFWNLRDSRATPVAGEEKGVAMVSGFSKNLLNLFLEEGGVINPKAVMEMAIAGDEFKELVVFD